MPQKHRPAPVIERNDIERIIRSNQVPRDRYPVVAVAIRGWRHQENKRGQFDDLLAVSTPDDFRVEWHNTDPSGFKAGWGTGSNKGRASLAPGIHIYVEGPHKGRPAFRQGEVFTVVRDGNPSYRHVGWHAINFHDAPSGSIMGGRTSSHGCQTLPKKETWRYWYPWMLRCLKEYGNELRCDDSNQWRRMKGKSFTERPSYPYILIDEDDRARGNIVVSRRYFPQVA